MTLASREGWADILRSTCLGRYTRHSSIDQQHTAAYRKPTASPTNLLMFYNVLNGRFFGPKTFLMFWRSNYNILIKLSSPVKLSLSVLSVYLCKLSTCFMIKTFIGLMVLSILSARSDLIVPNSAAFLREEARSKFFEKPKKLAP